MKQRRTFRTITLQHPEKIQEEFKCRRYRNGDY